MLDEDFLSVGLFFSPPVLCGLLGVLLAKARRRERVLTARVSTLEMKLAPGSAYAVVARGDALGPVGILLYLVDILFYFVTLFLMFFNLLSAIIRVRAGARAGLGGARRCRPQPWAVAG